MMRETDVATAIRTDPFLAKHVAHLAGNYRPAEQPGMANAIYALLEVAFVMGEANAAAQARMHLVASHALEKMARP